MKQFICGVFLAFILVLAPGTVVLAQDVSTESAYRTTLLQLITSLQEQIALLQAQLEQQTASVQVTGRFSDEMLVKAVYPVVGGQISTTNSAHLNAFLRVQTLVPNQYSSTIKEFVIFSDPEERFAAYVEATASENVWRFALNQSVLTQLEAASTDELIVHEFGHILSYDEMLGVPRPSETHCASYFAEQGCPLPNSYLAAFVDQFWSSADLSRAELFSDSSTPFIDAADYYQTHTTEYVSDYAALSPEEDFAESFADFVLFTYPRGNEVQDKKIDFFYQFQALRTTQAHIQSQL